MSERLDALRETVEEIPDADPESVTLTSDGGHFVVDADEFSEEGEEILNDHGYVIVGGINVPGMTQVNVAEVKDSDDSENDEEEPEETDDDADEEDEEGANA